MKEGRLSFPDLLEAEAFVRASEAAYNDAVAETADAILRMPEARFVTLSGPSCSGKTTTANRLSQALASAGKDLHIISIDDFFISRREIYRRAAEKGTEPDFETIDAVDLPLFHKTVNAIRRGGEVDVPTFDFESGERGQNRKFRADRDDVFLFEGIQAVYPDIMQILGHEDCYSVYIEASESLRIGNSLFLPPEIRFFRRLVRDNKFRGADPLFVFSAWEGVRKNELKNIYPYTGGVDKTLNSTMAYGVNMLKPFLIPLLTEVLENATYGKEASRLLDAIREIEPIPASVLPANSVFHEFVG